MNNKEIMIAILNALVDVNTNEASNEIENCQSEAIIINRNRKKMKDSLYEMLSKNYGTKNVYQVSSNEFSVYIGNSPCGEPMYANIDLTMKYFRDRRTARKEFNAYDAEQEAEDFKLHERWKQEKKIEQTENRINNIINSLRNLNIEDIRDIIGKM